MSTDELNTRFSAGLRVSEYVLEECLGSGGFGEVWSARHHVWTDERVAIKLPTEPEYVRFIRREGVVVHGLRHPNIVRVKGLDPYGEPPYLVMELVNGPSLRDVLNEHPQGLPIPVVRTIFTGMLDALSEAHKNNVLHRDIKPGNVLLDLDGRSISELTVEGVKLSDFGLGVGTGDALQSIAQSASLAADNALVGTLPYIAPEIRDNNADASTSSDLYSIGVVLFEMLCGSRPAGAEIPSTLRVEAEPYDDIFRKLYTRADRRYSSAADVLLDLQRLNQPPLPHRSDPIPPPPLPVQDRASRGYVDRCQNCNEIVREDDQFCTQCGQQLVTQVRRCPNCNGYPGVEDRFCIFCGTTLPEVA